MEQWITLTPDNVLAALNMTELPALDEDNLSILEEVIGDVVAQVRGAVAQNRSNALPPGDSIPRSIKRDSLALIRVDLLARFDLEVTDLRQTAANNAEKKLALIASGKWQIPGDDGTVDTPPSQTPELISPPPAYGTHPQGLHKPPY